METRATQFGIFKEYNRLILEEGVRELTSSEKEFYDFCEENHMEIIEGSIEGDDFNKAINLLSKMRSDT